MMTIFYQFGQSQLLQYLIIRRTITTSILNKQRIVLHHLSELFIFLLHATGTFDHLSVHFLDMRISLLARLCANLVYLVVYIGYSLRGDTLSMLNSLLDTFQMILNISGQFIELKSLLKIWRIEFREPCLKVLHF